MVTDDRARDRQFSSDRETIRNWMDRHDIVPIREDRDGGEDRYRMLPKRHVEGPHDIAEWDHFFEEFDDGDRVIVYHGEDATEPFEVRKRGDVASELDGGDVEERLLAGETVTSTVTETAAVESVVSEELAVESELVDTETIDQEILDAKLLDRDVVDYEVVENDAGDDAAFNTDRYLEAIGGRTPSAPGGGPTTFEGAEISYDAEIEVEERWAVIRDVTEEYVVESEITGTEVTEADTLEDYDLDLGGLHRSIAESGIIEDDLSTEDFLTEYESESELGEDDRVTTSFTRHRTVEDEVLDRKRVHGDLTSGEIQDMELVRTDDVVHGDRDRVVERADVSDTTGSTGTTDATETGKGSTSGGVTLTEDDVGKTVVDPTGDEMGTITVVDETAGAMYVDPDPGLTGRIKSTLGWGDAGEGDYRLDATHVSDVTDDEIQVDHHEGDEIHDRS